MATNYIDYEKLYNAQGALRNQIDDILDLIAEIKEIKNNIETIKETHDGFGTSLTWAQDILERLREYRALYSTIATYCRDAISIFKNAEGDIDPEKLKDFNKSRTGKDFYKILTGEEGNLELQLEGKNLISKTKDNQLIGNIWWSRSKLKDNMTKKYWEDVTAEELEHLTGATVAKEAKSNQPAANKGKAQQATNNGGGGSQSYSGGGSGVSTPTLTTMGTAGLGIGGAAAGIGSAISGGSTTVGETAASSKEEKDKKESVEETKTDETKTTETTTDQKTGDTTTTTTQVEETKTEETKDTALDSILKGAETTKTELKTAVDNAKTEVKDALKASENNLTDKMEEVKKTVEENAHKETTPAPTENTQPQQTTPAPVAKEPVQAAQPKVEQPKVEAPKTEPSEPTTETPAPTDPVETEPVDPNPIEEPVVEDPEPVHTKIPEDDSTSTVTKVPSEEPKSSSSSSSGGASKVVPVIAGVAAAGAAGVGTKIYLDNKSAPENTYINEEFVVDDSDYSASTAETAEVGTDTDLLQEETSSYTTRANSETTDSKDDMLDSGIGDDLTYGMKMTDDNVSFDESTPYEAIDNYEMGETH